MNVMICALGLGDLAEHGLEPLLELAAVLRAGDHRAEVERDHALVLERLGHVARRRSAARAPRRSPSCRRPARRSAPGCSSCGARAPGSRGGSRRRARSPGRACPRRASSVRSRPYRSSTWYFSSGFWSVTRCRPRTSASAASTPSRCRPASRRIVAPRECAPRAARAAGARSRRTRRVSASASRNAVSSTVAERRRDPDLGGPCAYTFGRRSSAASTRSRSGFGATPSACSSGYTTPSGSESSANSRCSGSIVWWFRASACCRAPSSAACDFIVSLLRPCPSSSARHGVRAPPVRPWSSPYIA